MKMSPARGVRDVLCEAEKSWQDNFLTVTSTRIFRAYQQTVKLSGHEIYFEGFPFREYIYDRPSHCIVLSLSTPLIFEMTILYPTVFQIYQFWKWRLEMDSMLSKLVHNISTPEHNTQIKVKVETQNHRIQVDSQDKK